MWEATYSDAKERRANTVPLNEAEMRLLHSKGCCMVRVHGCLERRRWYGAEAMEGALGWGYHRRLSLRLVLLVVVTLNRVKTRMPGAQQEVNTPKHKQAQMTSYLPQLNLSVVDFQEKYHPGNVYIYCTYNDSTVHA